MLHTEITEARTFVKKLLMEPIFDNFLLVKAEVVSNAAYTIDGRLHPDFYDNDELSALPSDSYVAWKAVREHVYNIIRGNKLPLHFKIVLILSDTDIDRWITANKLTLSRTDIANLSLNIYYDGNAIQVTAMATSAVFSINKALPDAWDTSVSEFLRQNHIL